ncbi:MAG: hypothetical protein C0490_22965, partial [Marivirga sp.]|nr:hypothetical protein [Marivirga sp.]
FKMKASFIYTNERINTVAIVLICVTGLLGMVHLSYHKGSSNTKEFSQNRTNGDGKTSQIIKLYITSNEFSSTDQSGRNESLQQTFCSPLYAYKLIRSSVFDAEQAYVLSQKLTWYTQSTYLRHLSPFWHPSIPIAHRKLII